MAASVDPALSSPVPDPGPEAPPAWNIATRIVFRFVCVYWVLYNTPGITLAWQALAPWVAKHVFHLTGSVTTYQPTGSGDTTLDYIQNLVIAILAAAGAAVWSALDWKRSDYRPWRPLLTLLLRYSLGSILLSYGFAKVFPLQFPYPSFDRMLEQFGDFSPMGVLWSFMGASPAYTVFAGSMELLGGVLLLFRRTATLGALVSAGVLLNVVLLNFCYDVPVKLFSTNLFLMAVTIAAPDAGNLAKLFLLRQPCDAMSVAGPVFEQRSMRLAGAGLKVVLIGSAAGLQFYSAYQEFRDSVLHPAHPPLYGIYQVESFGRDGKEMPPLSTDQNRWRTLAASYATSIQIKMMDDSMRGYRATYGPDANTVTLDDGVASVFTYSRPDPDHLVMTGKLGVDSLVVKLARRDPSKFLLVRRGFHWITEFPFNR